MLVRDKDRRIDSLVVQRKKTKRAVDIYVDMLGRFVCLFCPSQIEREVLSEECPNRNQALAYCIRMGECEKIEFVYKYFKDRDYTFDVNAIYDTAVVTLERDYDFALSVDYYQENGYYEHILEEIAILVGSFACLNEVLTHHSVDRQIYKKLGLWSKFSTQGEE